jgi:hypothetical protein
VTVIVNDRNAVADLLDHVAELVRQNKVEGLSIAMAEDGKARVSVTFAPGEEEDLTLVGVPPEEADTEPGRKIDPEVSSD